MISATLGEPERRNDSVLPAQSWNSSQTTIGFFTVCSALAMVVAAEAGIEK